MRLGQLIADTPCRIDSDAGHHADLDRRVCDVVEDSRTAVPGCLFIARRGTVDDGARHAPEAVAAGAEAVLLEEGVSAAHIPSHATVLRTADVPRVGAQVAERFFGDPSRELMVAGVTGTNGKTTVAHFAWRILNDCGIRTGLVGTVCIDDGRDMGDATLTTPPATELSRSLASMCDAGCRAVVLECSSHALHQGRVAGLAFDVGVYTNLSGDHLDYHGTMEAYAAAKSILFASLPEDGLAVLNAEDAYAGVMRSACRAGTVWTSGRERSGADLIVRTRAGARLGLQELELVGPWGDLACRLPVLGGHNAVNLLQAVAIAHRFGAPGEAIARAIGQLIPPRGRLTRVEPDAGDAPLPLVYVDFAHTDDALATTLREVRTAMEADASAGSRRLWVVFGCGGDRDRTKRPRMGRVAAEHADRVVITSDNPRTEPPGSIIGDILEGVPADRRSAVDVHADRASAIEHALAAAEPGDVVVIAGKGHEREQILPDGPGGVRRVMFDDAQAARSALLMRASAWRPRSRNEATP